MTNRRQLYYTTVFYLSLSKKKFVYILYVKLLIRPSLIDKHPKNGVDN